MPVRSKPPFVQALRSARACVCPNCARGPRAAGGASPPAPCPSCRLTFDPEPGYSSVAIYLNSIASPLLTAVLDARALPIRRLSEASVTTQIFAWVSVGILVCLGLMRYAYSFWISVDFWLTPWEPGVEHPLG